MAIFNGALGADGFIGADEVADTFNFTPANLAAADTIRGGNAPGVIDVLRFTANGIIGTEMLSGVRGIERILLADGGNLLTRPVDLEASAQDRTLEIRGGAGGDTILGGFSPDATLSLRFLTGSNSTAMLAEVSGFEEFILAGTAGTSLILDNAVLANAGPLLTITGGTEAALVNASAVNLGRILFRAASGADTLIGGGGNDTIELNGAAQGDLGAGRDTLRMLGPAAAEGAMGGGAGFNPTESLFFSNADSVTSGSSSDIIRGAGDNDTLRGGGGNDVLSGGDGLDSVDGQDGDDFITGGNGADSLVARGLDEVTGGLGGDVITLTEGVAAADRVRFSDNDDGSVDINTSVAENTADRLIGFNPANDIIVLNRSGLGLGSGGVVSVAANGAWNIGTGVVFIFESNSINSDTLQSNNFGALSDISFAINSDNAVGFGSSAGRTVALLVSNFENLAVRRTGLYVWTDTDGDNLLAAGDTVQMLGVLEGVAANQLSALNVLIG